MPSLIDTLPNSSVNNSRSIMRRVLEKQKKYPSEARGMFIEEAFPEASSDYKSGDEGMEPERHNFDN